MNITVLEVRNLNQIYGVGCEHCISSTGAEMNTNICTHCGSIVALGDLSLDLHQGESLGIVGESGSGKSTLVKSLYFDQKISSGDAWFTRESGERISLFEQHAARQRWLRNHIFGMVYQNPHLGLNFDFTVGGNIAERLLMGGERNFENIRTQVSEYLEKVEISKQRMDDLPASFSGGMQQRVQIAKALVTKPSLIFLDEVTTGLDLSVQAKILDLILELRYELNVSMIVVTHDLGVVRLLADRTMVMKNGRVVECGITDQVLHDPQHAYTQRLVASEL